MSAAELIERYGFEGSDAEYIEQGMGRAQTCIRIAADFRSRFPAYEFPGIRYGLFTGERLFRQYMGEARTYGWLVSKLIDLVVRAELVEIDRQVAAGAWTFYEPACGDETCADCERPMWHHVISDTRDLECPTGRRFWQIARALTEQMSGGGHDHGACLLREIARRA